MPKKPCDECIVNDAIPGSDLWESCILHETDKGMKRLVVRDKEAATPPSHPQTTKPVAPALPYLDGCTRACLAGECDCMPKP